MNYSWVEVQSTTLVRAAYCDQPALLRLHFHSGAHYIYADVPPEVFRNLLKAPSKGAFFNRHIRGLYAYARAADEN